MTANPSRAAASASDPRGVAWWLLVLIGLYQRTLSRVLAPACRFEPSCSRYAAASIAARGALRGGLLSIRRVCKCHPFHPGGYDPPPTRALERGTPEAR